MSEWISPLSDLPIGGVLEYIEPVPIESLLTVLRYKSVELVFKVETYYRDGRTHELPGYHWICIGVDRPGVLGLQEDRVLSYRSQPLIREELRPLLGKRLQGVWACQNDQGTIERFLLGLDTDHLIEISYSAYSLQLRALQTTIEL